MSCRYWKVICRYGHVGRRNEVSVARYIRTESHYTIIDAMDLVSNMPGVKSSGVAFIEQIDKTTFEKGKSSEKMSLYLQKLKTYNPKFEQINKGEKLYA
ncbi:hypothetical protein [Mesobacillus jeotgali]|uniref:hypothetical protein n=1 Tax=Mesobacillus jeotgali TaxID=129985 RepID=UPI000C8197DD|nr:hypothetical protein [Mesobacillus jeotgali]